MRQANVERLSNAETSLTDPNYLVYSYLFDALRQGSRRFKGKLLDIGCGNKPYRAIFDSVSEYLGCDIVQSSANSVDVICDVVNIPICDESFDSILSTQVIEHVQEPQKLCSEAYRMLKPGGYFMVSGPMYWHLHEEPHDFHRFTRYGFQLLLENAGFELVEIIPNGGKWAMLGLVTLHTFAGTPLQRGFITSSVNRIFSWLDTRRFDPISTSNYVAVAKKPVN